MFLYVIAYDIPSDKRRKKVADLLEGYGQRVQYSVFECQLNAEKYQELRRQLRKKLNLTEDNIRFYPLSRHTIAQVETWGVGLPVLAPPSSVII